MTRKVFSILCLVFISTAWAGGPSNPYAYTPRVYNNGTLLPLRMKLNFDGTGVTCVDDSTNKQTTCTGNGGSSTPTFNDATSLLANSWVTYSGGGAHTPGYYKDASGTVHIEGLLSSGTCNQKAFTLPSGFRPSGGFLFFASQASGSTLSQVKVESTGDVTIFCSSNTYIIMDGISFLAGA